MSEKVVFFIETFGGFCRNIPVSEMLHFPQQSDWWPKFGQILIICTK